MIKSMVLEAFKQSLQTIRPNELVKKVFDLGKTLSTNSLPGPTVHLDFDALRIKHCASDEETIIQCGPGTKLTVVSFGKAAIPMMEGIQSVLGSRMSKGIVIAPEDAVKSPLNSIILCGGRNNLPDENSTIATHKLVNFILQEDSEENLFLFLISGGGSALLCSPVEGITLNDKLATIKKMVSCGATISELNAVRQRLSNVKGGKLLQFIKKSRLCSLIISDVIGDPLQYIASGPTVIPEHPIDCLEIIHRLGVEGISPAVKGLLQRIYTIETEVAPMNLIIANNSLPLKFLKRFLEENGFATIIATTSLSGDATVIGRDIAHLILSEKKLLLQKTAELLGKTIDQEVINCKVALVFGGETTVEMKTAEGVATPMGEGGRNQHLALAAYNELLKNKCSLKHSFVLLSAGSDGIDGPTNAAGAYFSDKNVKSSTDTCLELSNDALGKYNSYGFWSETMPNSHIIVGPTGTNVMDIIIVLLDYN